MSDTPRAGIESLPMDLAQCVDQVCDRFEDAWLAGQRPAIEDHLDGTPAAVQMILLRELLRLELHYCGRDGEQPAPAEYQRRFPTVGELIDELFREGPAPVPQPAKTPSGKDTMQDSQRTGQYGSQAPGTAKKAAPLPSIPGYEILGVLGQGGMGVVYQARHVQLDRLVALKMIRGADEVPEDMLRRFLVEAKAVAHLQHPNIVQIHEIGEHDGAPYFSLEYVNGGNLATHIKGQPQPPREAAALLETLARAMHYAHQRQIIHRDLKPANILLQRKSVASDPKSDAKGSDCGLRIADFDPKVTDFGLAKQLDADLGQTRADAVMGTPSYMAPEQASGHTGESGLLADVYALGAILYELLTGRPPFKAATMLDTLEQVRTQEPVPPSQLQSRVPRDLETICLKCLAKEPAHRYSSALMLAQDLERFQAGEPILGRREGLTSRCWRKARRNPLMTAAAVAMLGLAVAGFLASRAYQDRQGAATDRRITDLAQEIEVELRSPEPTENYLQRLEARIADLDGVAPDKAAAARNRLYERFAERIEELFRDRLTAADVARIESGIALLKARDPRRADGVQQKYAQRKQTWEPLFALTAPFANLNTVFDAAPLRVERTANHTQLGRVPSDSKTKTSPYVWARVAYSGKARLVAVLDRSWATASELKLSLTYGWGKAYSFGLRVSPGPNNQPLSTFAAAKKSGGDVDCHIYRYLASGISDTLNICQVPAAELFAGCPPDGSLRLEAKREGERLSFQVNSREPLEFRDYFPFRVSEADGFQLFWPETVRLKSLHAYHLPGPAVPSVLETADDLLSQGKAQLALAAYQQVLVTSSHHRMVRQEARYKEGVCLVALKRQKDAIPVFQELAGEAGADLDANLRYPWPLLADCQLLTIYARQQTAEARGQASAILDQLALRYGNRSGEFGLLLPATDRNLIQAAIPFRGVNLISHRPEDLVRDAERAIKAADLFEPSRSARMGMKTGLIKVYRLAGREFEAMQITEELVRNFQEYCQSSYGFGAGILDAYGWISRLRVATGAVDVEIALKELDRWLFSTPGVIRRDAIGSAFVLLIERARIHAALKKWDQAEKDLERFFQEASKAPNLSYVDFAGACLLQGFLRERRGDVKGALETWRRGSFSVWKKKNALLDPKKTAILEGGGIAIIYGTILASLSGESVDLDANGDLMRLFSSEEQAIKLTGGDSPTTRLVKLFNVRPESLRQMWLTSRGREWARRIAFRDLSVAEYYRVPAFLLAYEMLHQGALPAWLSAEQDELLWKLVKDGYAAYLADHLNEGHMLALGSVWKGLNLPGFGWASAARVLDPSVRGPAAYILGHRYLRLKNPRQAVDFFRTALADAPVGSPLRRLADAELHRLTRDSLPALAARSVGLSSAPLGDGWFVAPALLSGGRSNGK